MAAAAAAGGGGFDFGGGGFADIFDEMFGEFMGGRRGGGGQPGRGADLRYNMEITLEEAFTGKTGDDPGADLGRLRGLRRHGRRAGTKPITCPTCRGVGKVRAQQGFFTDRAHLPGLPRRAAGSSRIPAGLRRARAACREEKHASGQHPARRRGRHAHPPGRRGRGGLARRARRAISTSSSSIAPHPFFQRDGANIFIAACRSR